MENSTYCIYVDDYGRRITRDNGEIGKGARHQAIIVVGDSEAHYLAALSMAPIVVNFDDIKECAKNIHQQSKCKIRARYSEHGVGIL